MKSFNKKNTIQSEDEYAIFISDFMSVLMVIFLFIAITFIHNVQKKDDYAKEIIDDFQIINEEIIDAIKAEFLDEFSDWNALVDPVTLSFQFNSPDVLFKKGSSELTDKFKQVLNDFFPRYINIIKQENYLDQIKSIQIEGHTSSEWDKDTKGLNAYLKNMELSQERSAKVLEYVLKSNDFGEKNITLRNMISSVGYSSSNLLYADINGEYTEDRDASRRVAFRILTKGEKKIEEVSEITM
ncbi:MAG: OmpA family protein [Candidatus Neomarinimicrobiota bacterium]|nr:OmpA family protein [Candidatus Neomarinimicrobiota bacterium]